MSLINCNRFLFIFSTVILLILFMCEISSANKEESDDIKSSESQSNNSSNFSNLSGDISEGRKKKDKQHLEMIQMGLNHIKSVVQMVMMGISQMLQFKGVLISLVGVVIQALRLLMDFKKKEGMGATIMVKHPSPPSYPHYSHYEGKSSAPGYDAAFTPGDVSSAYSNPAGGYENYANSYNTQNAHH